MCGKLTLIVSDVLERIEYADDNWNFEDKVTAEEVAASNVCDKLREVQRFCEEGCETVPTFIVVVV